MQISQRIYSAIDHPAPVIAGIKAGLARLGICGDTMAEPFPPLTDAQREEIGRAMADLGLLDAAMARAPSVD